MRNFRFRKYSHKVGTINVLLFRFVCMYRITKLTCAQLVNACQLPIVMLDRQFGANANFSNYVIIIANAHAQSLSMCVPSLAILVITCTFCHVNQAVNAHHLIIDDIHTTGVWYIRVQRLVDRKEALSRGGVAVMFQNKRALCRICRTFT
jgi:hypothetical protein